MISYEALSELHKAKNKLDLGLIGKEEFESLKISRINNLS
jgi:hypothetical protein